MATAAGAAVSVTQQPWAAGSSTATKVYTACLRRGSTHSTEMFKDQPGSFKSPKVVEWSSLENPTILVEGSRKTIYTATLAGQQVAVRTPKKGLATRDLNDVNRELQHEANILANVQHSNIVQFHGVGRASVESGAPLNIFVVVEKLEYTLSTRVHGNSKKSKEGQATGKPKPMSHEVVLETMTSLADALLYLHAGAIPNHSVALRDLRPENIGFDQAGTLKLFEFSLCAILPAGDKRTKPCPLTGQVGRVRYMAPEMGLSQPYNETIDVYAFALVSWEMSHAKKPYQGLNAQVHKSVVCKDGARPDFDFGKPVPFQELLGDCWSGDITQRPSFKVVVERLREMFVVYLVENSEGLVFPSPAEIINMICGCGGSKEGVTPAHN